MNIPATLNFLKLIRDPTLILPQSTIPQFSHLPIPLNRAFAPETPTIRAIVVDKDNCFAIPHSLTPYPPYLSTFNHLRKTYPGPALLIVSNTAGYAARDPTLSQARELEKATGIPVLAHNQPKPFCGDQIMDYLREKGVCEQAEEVAVVGDRLATDVAMANMMGAWGVWVRDGVPGQKGVLAKMETGLEGFLRARGWEPRTVGKRG